MSPTSRVLSRRAPLRVSALAAMCAALVVAAPARANPDRYGLGNGHNGAFTAASANQIINTYTAVTAAATSGSRTVSVASATGIAAGDLVLVWQVQGGPYASGAAGPFPLGGDAPGGYDLVRVASVSGTTLNLAAPLTENYAAAGAQVVRVPEYTTVSVPTGTSLTAPAWNGTTGGVVIFLATGAVSLVGAIHANGLGGRGGAVSNNVCNASCACAASDDVGVLDDSTCNQGRRGEGLDRSASGFGATVCGIGNRSTGGGGAGHINAGGAGGGNGGAGGHGGDAWCTTPGQPTGGRPGAAVSGSLVAGLSFGGGGGGGQQNNNGSTPGGAGGGVVFVRALSLTGTGSITANGNAAANGNSDGAGGGGAGGSVLVRLVGTATCGSIQALGGVGGSISGHGGGGGGGGGRLRVDAGSVSGCAFSVNGAAAGTGWTGATAGQMGVVAPNGGAFGCANDAACTGDTPVCDMASRACRACATDADCPMSLPVCASSGACVRCTAMRASACTGATPLCDAATNTCVACLADADCPATAPVCNTTTRACGPCTADTACAPRMATPACNTTSGACVECTATNRSTCTGTPPLCDVTRNTCVACLTDADCDAATPVCSPTTRTCGRCSADAQCAARTDAPACDVTAGACVRCTADNGRACTGATPLCDAAAHVCVGCRNAGDCRGMAPVCDTTSRACRACMRDGDCGGATPACQPSGACGQCSATSTAACMGTTPVCDTAAGACVGCVTAADCRATTPLCDATSHTCRGCMGDAECGGTTPACSASGACVQCTMANAAACVGATPVCAPSDVCVLCVPGAGGDATACAMNPAGRACVQPDAMMAAFCGCATDADCGTDTSGRVCDPGTRRCVDGCSPDAMRNRCPAGLFCTSNDPARVGTCTSTCNFDSDCAAVTPARPRCLGAGDAGVSLGDGGTSACVECVADTDCGGRSDGRARCVGANNTCAQCSPASRDMCTPTGVGTACLGTGLCGCTEDADCAADRMCDRALNRCVERPIVDAGTDAGRDAGDDVMVAEAGADAGASTDTGVSKDAGANDAGKDVAMAFDAPTADASGNALSGGSGCGCAVLGSRAGGGAWSLLALAAVLFVRRRRALT